MKRPRSICYQISVHHSSGDILWWQPHYNKFVKDVDYTYSFTNWLQVRTRKKVDRVLRRFRRDYPEYQIDLSKDIFDRSKKWPQGCNKLYKYDSLL